ncbi:MAG: signal recognition particle-docking protein FtsY [Lachnospiraceae bacterium]|nr:signal recognition particle-docking protein FtsY [Lachnospiraceae bacterium]
MGIFDFLKPQNKQEETQNEALNENEALNIGSAEESSENENSFKNLEEKEPETKEPLLPTEENQSEKELPKSEGNGLFKNLFKGLTKTRESVLSGMDAVLGSFKKIDEELFEELEELLIMADIGFEPTMNILDRLRVRVKKENVSDPSKIKSLLIDEITEILKSGEEEKPLKTPTVILVIGVNGVGKTTTIGKLAFKFKKDDKSVVLAAADTFRAAAIDQLEIWGERAGIEVIKHEENSDPAAVVFDAVNYAKNKKTDILICDTAGRLHNKKNLMDELKKISNVISKEYPKANKEVYLVIDATTGQNALQQAKIFTETAQITGIILTKLDGTAKGGIVIAIKEGLNMPIKYIGVGEAIEDLQEFDPYSFAKAIFGE